MRPTLSVTGMDQEWREENGVALQQPIEAGNEAMQELIMEAVNTVMTDQGEFVQVFQENVIWIIGSYSATGETTEYDEQIEEREQKLLSLIEESAKSECADDVFDKAYRELADDIKGLKQKWIKVLQEKKLAEAYEQRVEGMGDYVRKTGYLKWKFDDELARQLLQTVKVVNEKRLEIQIQSGIAMDHRIDHYD